MTQMTQQSQKILIKIPPQKPSGVVAQSPSPTFLQKLSWAPSSSDGQQTSSTSGESFSSPFLVKKGGWLDKLKKIFSFYRLRSQSKMQNPVSSRNRRSVKFLFWIGQFFYFFSFSKKGSSKVNGFHSRSYYLLEEKKNSKQLNTAEEKLKALIVNKPFSQKEFDSVLKKMAKWPKAKQLLFMQEVFNAFKTTLNKAKASSSEIALWTITKEIEEKISFLGEKLPFSILCKLFVEFVLLRSLGIVLEAVFSRKDFNNTETKAKLLAALYDSSLGEKSHHYRREAEELFNWHLGDTSPATILRHLCQLGHVDVAKSLFEQSKNIVLKKQFTQEEARSLGLL